MTSCKLGWLLVAVLSAVVAVFAYKFTVGEVKPSTDGRMGVQLSTDERNALLLEMRTWLQSAQGISPRWPARQGLPAWPPRPRPPRRSSGRFRSK